MTKLTRKQRAVYDYALKFRAEKHYSPTSGEIARRFGWRSTNSARMHLLALRRKGWATWVWREYRGLVLTAAPAPARGGGSHERDR